MVVFEKVDVFVLKAELGVAFRIGGEVEHVAGVMALWIIQAMLLVVGIEMRAGGLEIRTLALCVLVKMNCVLPGLQAVQVELESDARSLLPQNNVAHAFALRVLQFSRSLGCAKKGRDEAKERYC